MRQGSGVFIVLSLSLSLSLYPRPEDACNFIIEISLPERVAQLTLNDFASHLKHGFLRRRLSCLVGFVGCTWAMNCLRVYPKYSLTLLV